MTASFSNEQINQAINRLNAKLLDMGAMNDMSLNSFSNTTIVYDFSKKSIKRANVVNGIFENCVFYNAAATGSRFVATSFLNCNFTGSNFQYCIFDGVNFQDSSLLKSANFSHSFFINCTFNNISIIGSTLYDCRFEECNFINSTIQESTFESSTFYSCVFQKIDLSCTNLEYINFKNSKFNEIVFPPYQIPYIIGIQQFLFGNSQKNYVFTDTGLMSVHEYKKLCNDLEVYFFAKKEFFPIINLKIIEGDCAEAYEYLQRGIKDALDCHDFRMIKHYCRLACASSAYSNSQLRNLYDTITSFVYNCNMDAQTLHSYVLNLGEIKELLLNNADAAYRMEFVIKTTIEKDDLEKINLLYNQINSILKENCSDSHIDYIELRHNSPYEMYITCVDALPQILMVISALYGAFAVSSKVLDFVNKVGETKKLYWQNRLYRIEEEAKKVMEETEAQLKKSGNISICSSVVELEHMIKCSSLENAKKIDTDILRYKITNKSNDTIRPQ